LALPSRCAAPRTRNRAAPRADSGARGAARRAIAARRDGASAESGSSGHPAGTAREAESHPENNFLVRYVSKHIPLTRDYREDRFFVRENGKRFATPLFLVLLVVEITDVTFAVDSIPAIFGITRDPFIVFTSNVFAILGLRALYFLLAGVLDKFAYLKIALALVLVFIGGKMIVEPWLHISVGVSLGVVMGMLATAVVASLLLKPKKVVEVESPRS